MVNNMAIAKPYNSAGYYIMNFNLFNKPSCKERLTSILSRHIPYYNFSNLTIK